MTKIEYPGSLHNHTEYSNERLRDCIIKLPQLIDYAIELGHEVVAITDHETISGHVKAEKYYTKIKKEHPNFKLILGNEIYLCRNGLTADNFISGQDKYYHFILLAKDAIGHQQIRQISTRAWMRSYMSRGMRRVPTYYRDLFDIIGQNPGHVIASTACLGGALPTQLLKYRETKNEDLMYKIEYWCKRLQDVFGQENFFLEMQPSNNDEQNYVNNLLLKLSEKLNIPYIITTDSHYLKKEDRIIHKAYLNAQNGEREVDAFYATTYMMNTKELEEYIKLSEEQLQTAYKNIIKIKEMCEDYSLLKSLKIPQLKWKELDCLVPWNYHFEDIPFIENFVKSEDYGDRLLAACLAKKINENNDEFCNKQTYHRINTELESTWVSSEVNKTHWSAYFLNLQKIIEECWAAGTLVGPGRGSGVGFLLLYMLDITQINPLRENTKTFSWRFLNPDRVSVLDVDVDIEGGRRAEVLKRLREVYGYDRVANVVTFGTEKAKSAILTAARGLGIDIDIAQYLSSMVESDRGIQRTLKQTFYGDEENGFTANKQFIFEMTENYPELWEVAQKIEGLVCRVGVHAGGVIFVDEPFEYSTALMRAPDNTIITQFDLHDCEDVSLIKYDLLSVEALDKIHTCIDLICDYGYAQRKETLKDTYESIIGVYKLERDNIDMWKMTWNHEIISLFQMEKQSGVQGIALTHPQSVDDLATLNSVIRLMAQEKGAEQPLNKYARFKKNIALWYKEMENYGLTKEEQKLLEPIVKISYGICESQERFMQLVQLPECGGFDLTWADSLRKSIAKKNPAAYEKLQEEYFEVIKEKKLSKNLCNYVWNVLVATSRGYGFNLSHTLAYSLIAVQEMNLAFKYPILFWNCACLITDSGGVEDLNEDDDENIYEQDYNIDDINYYNEMEEFTEDDDEEDIEDSYEEEDCDGYPATVCVLKNEKKKKKVKATNYGKIATAIGKMKTVGIQISPPDINKSSFTFSPDIKNNSIIHGLSGITRIGVDIISQIIENRPFVSIEDFLMKIKVTKPQMVNLIKSGAFDELYPDRIEAMKEYIVLVSKPKKRVTLQNMAMLINFNLLPDELNFEKKVFNFNKYLKKSKQDIYYILDEIAYPFWEANFDTDLLIVTDNQFKVKQTIWDNIYNNKMNRVRTYIKAHYDHLLTGMNQQLFNDLWDKYCSGNLSKWEMDSISYYSHEHELSKVNFNRYDIVDFFKLPEEPEVATTFRTKTGQIVPLFKISRIAGTVLDKNKDKKTVTLLTTSGVVTVKIYGQVFTNYDKQISEKGADGKKHIIEKSTFSRGNKIVVTGIRRGDNFIAKKYSRTPYHLVDQIIEINDDGRIVLYNRNDGDE